MEMVSKSRVLNESERQDYEYRFGGVERVYGNGALKVLQESHVMVIGVGGVGSWAAEALARSGVSELTLVDLDDICLSNTNRQIHAQSSQVGQLKVEALEKRFLDINPYIRINLVRDWANESTIDSIISSRPHAVIDCIDKAHNKAAIIERCVKHNIYVVTVGAAGGKKWGSLVKIKDLAFTQYDSLLSQTRRKLRQEKGFTRKTDKPFGVSAVHSEERVIKPEEACSSTPEAVFSSASASSEELSPGSSVPRALDCKTGFGALCHVTATFGLLATECVLSHLLERSSAKR